MSWVWAFVPLCTLGLGTALIMIFAAIRLRNPMQTVATVIYVAATALVLTLSREGGTEKALVDLAVTTNVLLGTGHALGIRSRVFSRHRPAMGASERQRQALETYEEQRHLREAARRIAAKDQQQAIAMQIGRIDIPGRKFPDGGLIDVNNVELDRLGGEIGALGPYLPVLVRTRQRLRGFASVEDMSVTLGLPPDLLDHESDRLVFLPRYEH